MNIEHVLEFSRPDIDGMVIRAVKVIGLKSKHGWHYSPEVLKTAMPLYESAPVFIEHPDVREKQKGHRQLGDHFGSLEKVRGNGQGLFADLKIKQSHPLATAVLEAARSGRFGLSHNAVVEMDDEKTNVTKIVEVNSVDLVNSPATTTNLFEANPQPDSGEFMEQVLASVAKIEELCEQLAAAQVAVTESKPAPKPVKRLVALEGADPNGETGNTHEAFMSVLRGFSLK